MAETCKLSSETSQQHNAPTGYFYDDTLHGLRQAQMGDLEGRLQLEEAADIEFAAMDLPPAGAGYNRVLDADADLLDGFDEGRYYSSLRDQ